MTTFLGVYIFTLSQRKFTTLSQLKHNVVTTLSQREIVCWGAPATDFLHTDYPHRTHHSTTGHYPAPWGTAATLSANTLPTAIPQRAAAFRTVTPGQPPNPWDDPTTVHDLESDTALTQRVAEAVHYAAAPLGHGNGKHVQFSHHLVTRGPKKHKTNLGELNIPVYIWGFIQLIKAKDPSDPDVVHMNAHLERIAENAKEYEWPSVLKRSALESH